MAFSGGRGCLFVGLATLDVILGVEQFPGANQKVTAAREAVAAGGPAANAAVTCVFLGCPAVLATALGASPLAALVRTELAHRGVGLVDVAPESNAPPPIAAVVVTLATGDRAVVSRGGRASAVAADARFAALVRESAAVLVDGHHPQLALAAVRTARAAGIPTILDGGSWKPHTAALLPFIDVAICSNDFHVPEIPDDARFRFLRGQGVGYAAITRGAAPIRWAAADGHGDVVVPAGPVVDTLGAGDVLHGAFVAATCGRQLTTARFVSALGYAGAIAARSCGSFGTRDWMSSPGPWPDLPNDDERLHPCLPEQAAQAGASVERRPSDVGG